MHILQRRRQHYRKLVHYPGVIIFPDPYSKRTGLLDDGTWLPDSGDYIYLTHNNQVGYYLTYGNGVIMAYGSAILFHSSNRGLYFIPYSSPAGLNSQLLFDGTQFTLRGDDGTYTSQNGMDWVEMAAQLSGVVKMRMANGVYVAHMSEQEYYMYSTDSLIWQQSNMTVKSRLQEANGLVFAFSDGGILNYTANGATWQTTSVGMSAVLNKIVYANGYYYVSTGSLSIKSNILLKSADLVAWTTITLPDSGEWISLGASAANIVAGVIVRPTVSRGYYSTDGGETWTSVSVKILYEDSILSVPALDVIN